MYWEKFSLGNVLKRSLRIWTTVFFIVFGISVLLASVYELFLADNPDPSPVYIFFLLIGCITLVIGILTLFRGRYRPSETEKVKSHLTRGKLFIQVPLPQDGQVKEIILDMEPIQVSQRSYLQAKRRKR